MRNLYLIRLDDACPTMDFSKWQRVLSILDKYNIHPMVGVIPHNNDPKQIIDPENKDFWKIVCSWEHKGYAIALHGYNHCYTSNEGLCGLNPMWRRSEFAGLPFEEQRDKIQKGIAIMRENGVNPKYFFAPSHTFDNNTLIALCKESDIRIISDTIATQPYRLGDFVFIPQFSGQCREVKMNGVFTFCLHPSTMTDDAFDRMEHFLKVNKSKFISFDDINIENVGGKSLFDRLLSIGYFTMRRLKGIR